MGRTRKNRDVPHPRPVERIHLSEHNVRARFVAAAVLLAVGVAAFAYAAHSSISAESGWTEIQADSGAETNCGGEFVFLYCLGTNGMSPTAEKKAVTALYTQAARKAYMLFTCDEEFQGMANICYINRHPNEEIQVDALLYETFSLLQEHGSRQLYLGPVYDIYDNVFYCEEDWQLADYDPRLNEDRAMEFGEIASFARNPEAVELLLLGNDRVCLRVSEEYLEYAAENGVMNFIDFYWMKNAFIVDYMADIMADAQYTAGSISSYDGFVRNFDDRNVSYSFHVYDRVAETVYPAAVMDYMGPRSMVYLRNYGINSLDLRRFYTLDNGEIRTQYLDIRDGLCRSAVNDLISYSGDMGCAEVLLRMIPVYISDALAEKELTALAENGVDSIYCKDRVIYHTEPGVDLTDFYTDGESAYTERPKK